MATNYLSARTIAVFAVVGCVLLAGCSGLGIDAPPDDGDVEEDEDVEEADDEEEPPNAEEGADEGDSERTDESAPPGDDPADDADEDGEHAGPDALQVVGVTHMEREGSLDHDAITLANVDDERALPIGGWEIELDGQDERIPIEEDAMIEPESIHTVQLSEGEKSLDEDGGVIHVYDADGDRVGSWNYVGAPGAPPEGDADAGYVQFTITDSETEEGIEGATVVLADGSGESFEGTTDGAGVTTVRNVPDGEYELTVTREGYADHVEVVAVKEGGTEMSIELEPSEEAAGAIGASTSAAV